MIALSGVALFILLLAIGVPILFVIAAVCLLYLESAGMPSLMIMQRMFVGLDQFIILAVPMFILTGKLMESGGTLRRLIHFALTLLGHVRGGLAQVNVAASMFFSGITGAATADVAALGPLEIEMMKKGGYPKDFATAVTISSSVIGPIVPPSIPLVIYGVVASTSIGGLFLAGVIPGLLMGLSLMALIWLLTFRFKVTPQPRQPLREMLSAGRDALGPLGLPLIILVGIYGGFFTPTEAAAVAALYAFVLGMFVYRELTWRHIPRVFLESALITAASLSILAISNMLSWIFSIELVPNAFAAFLLSLTDNVYLLFFFINVGLLLLGCIMETLAAIIITVPIFLPIMTQLGVDPIHFGVVIAINLTLGLLTPPLGLNLYIASAISGVRVERIALVNLPFLAVLIGVLFVVTYVPQLSLFLPNLLMNN